MAWQDLYFESGYAKRWTLPPPDAARERMVAAWLRLTGVPATARILDVGCGHGSHSLALARTGGAVVGLDGSAALLERARAHSALQRARVRWVRGDMRALPFRRHFDLALVINAFGYFDTEPQSVEILREIAQVLQPMGRLLLRNPNAVSIRNNFKSLIEEERNGCTIQLHNTLDERGHWMDQHVIVRGEEGVEEYQRRQRIYSADELEDVLERAEFASVRHFSSPEGAPFDESASPNLLTVCCLTGRDV